VERVKHGRGLWTLAGSAACVLAALFAVAALSPSTVAGPCTVVNEPALLHDVPEASGLAVGRGRPVLLWTHNDSGNAPDLFAIGADGAVQGRLRLPFRTRDWEDISAAPCPPFDFAQVRRGDGAQHTPRNCLYIGDIGDNDLTRRSVQVYVVPELTPGTAVTGAGRPPMFSVTYSDGAHNAEAMFIAGGYLFIVTKDRAGIVYRSTSPLGQGGSVTMQRVTELELTGVTDAEASADEESVAVRTSDEVVIYRAADLVDGETVPQGVRIPIAGLREPQGEGVALGADGIVYLTSEGGLWNRAGRLITLRCSFERPT
jgi:hypothetical protein